jgi:ATP-dependent Clp protease ATP-binding subunit ClpA
VYATLTAVVLRGDHRSTMFERMSTTARRVLAEARGIAEQHHHATVEPAHLLLALVERPPGAPSAENTAVAILRRLGVSMNFVQEEAKRLLASKPGCDRTTTIGFDRASDAVLREAVNDARRLQDRSLGTEHLLLGLLASESPVASVLARMGVRHDRALATTAAMRGTTESERA